SSRRRHTRSYGDWSSDVCSSDLGGRSHARERALPNSPSRRDGVHLPSPPTDRAVAVEQQTPTRGALFRGQDVEPLGGAPRGGLRSEERRVGNECGVWGGGWRCE